MIVTLRARPIEHCIEVATPWLPPQQRQSLVLVSSPATPVARCCRRKQGAATRIEAAIKAATGRLIEP
jgi:hypothetical protein